MTRASLTLLALLGLAMSTHGQAPAPVPPAKEAFQLFLLAGQSNMAGRGKVEAADLVPTPGVLMFDRARTWVPAIDPMHFDKPVAGVGLGRAFAARIADANPGVTIGLIPVAAGGSPIDTWKPGGYHDQTKSHPWDDAVARAKVAMQAGPLKAILWHQGESDATPQLAPGYEAKLHDLIARFRVALDAPDLPFVAGQLGRFEGVPWDEARRTVDAAHRALPEKVPHTGELGQRYAAAYEGLARRR